MTDENPPHQRRVRYPGKNPRRFEDRYKELNPVKYSGVAEHVIAKGQTPAGAHRPICVDEILAILHPQPGELCLDATLGHGGHSEQLLRRILPGGRLFAVDTDPLELVRAEARLRGLGFDEDALVVRKMNFSAVRGLASECGGFDAVVADLGVSSMQLDNPARGFTYKAAGPLDLRLDPGRGQTASELLQAVTVEELEELLVTNADEPHARAIARAIKVGPIATTTRLAEVITARLTKLRPAVPENEIKKSLQRTFMAIRIQVNDEFTVLERFLKVLPDCLRPGGRVAILSFHSGEDRRVKKAFTYGEDTGLYAKIARTHISPGPAERHSNPRSACAKLRWAVRA